MDEEIKNPALRCIADVFKEHGIKFKTMCSPERESVAAGFAVENGPNLLIHFYGNGDAYDVAVRVYDIVINVSENRQPRILEACNLLNSRFRYLKYCLTNDNSVQLEYDFPDSCSEDIGDRCLMMMQVIMYFSDVHYGVLMKALYTEDAITCPEPDQIGADRDDSRISAISALTGMLS